MLSQNVVIDYEAWNPSNPPCKIFVPSTNVPATLGGVSVNISHLNRIGQTGYSGGLAEGDNYLYLGNGATWFEAQLGSSYNNGIWSNVWWEYVSGDYTPYTNSGIYRIGYDLSSYGGSNGYVDSYYNFHYTDGCGSYSVPFHFMQSYSIPPSYRMQQPPKEVYKISITPNPANAIVQLRVQEIEANKTPAFNQFNYTKPVMIRVYDKLGNLVMQQYAVIPKTGLKLNVAMLRHADLYNVIVDDGKGIRISGKLLKQ